MSTGEVVPTGVRKLRLFLVDDHSYIREGLRFLLSHQPDMEVVGEADNAVPVCQIAMERLPETMPDVIVMDLSLPGMSGIEATARVKQTCSRIRVIVLSMHEDATYLRTVLEAGASGYVLKRSASESLVQAIRSVAEGGTYIDPSAAGKLTAEYVRRSSSPNLRGDIAGYDLSEREEEVLRRVAHGFTGKEIADQLAISQKSVESYKTRALQKLQIEERFEIVRYAVIKGWL
jgi:DNA-binding NarL/FixJ family response regulator